MRVDSIRFPCIWEDGRGSQCADTLFKLGKGKCGKTVHDLTIEYREGIVEITQHCTDATVKHFFYQLKDITGRIEVEYDQARP